MRELENTERMTAEVAPGLGEYQERGAGHGHPTAGDGGGRASGVCQGGRPSSRVPAAMGTEAEPPLVALTSQLGRRRAVGSCPGNPVTLEPQVPQAVPLARVPGMLTPGPWPHAVTMQRKPLGRRTNSPAVPLDGQQLPLKC